MNSRHRFDSNRRPIDRPSYRRDEEKPSDEEFERSPEFFETVRRSRQQFKDGKCARIEDVWNEIMTAPEPD